MSASLVRINIDLAPALVFVAVEYLIGFFCFVSAMLFKERLAKGRAIMGRLFSPTVFWIAGFAHLLIASAVLWNFKSAPFWMFELQGFVQLLMCWSLTLHFMADNYSAKKWSNMLRLFFLSMGTAFCFYNFFEHIALNHQYGFGADIAICWATAFSLNYDRPKPYFSLPITYSAFCILGGIANITMDIGSNKVMDGPFFLSTAIRATQYVMLALSMMTVRFFGYSLQTWFSGGESIASRGRIEDTDWSLEEAKRLVDEVKNLKSSD